MAITPRTILSDPINLLLFAFALLALGGLLGVLAGANGSQTSNSAQNSWATDRAGDDRVANNRMDTDRINTDKFGPSDADTVTGGQVDSPGVDPLDDTCQLEEPAPTWSDEQWLGHLGCLEARGETAEALVAEAIAAIGERGLTPELAVKKADYLEVAGTPNAHLDFLEAAVTALGVSDGRLVHRLSQALTWRGEAADIERIRHLQLLSRMLMPGSCSVLQTDVWVRYALAEQLAEAPSPTAWEGVRRAIDTYVAHDCHLRDEQVRGQREVWGQQAQVQRGALTEKVGVGVVAEAINGHTGESTLIRQAAESAEWGGQMGDVRSFCRTFCRRAVPVGAQLRDKCEKRLGDELFLAR
jgi:hypothetical protein